MSQRFQKSLLTLGVGAFLAMSFFGIFHFGMGMSMDGKISNCPFMSGMNVCPMTPFEHASFMQGLFTDLLPQANSMLAFLLALSTIAVISFSWFLLRAPPLCRSTQKYRGIFLDIESLFQQLLSSGILNPKLFA